MTKYSCVKMSFTMPFGKYEFTVMSFDLVRSPAMLQRLIDRILSGISNACAYMDDIVVFSVSWPAEMLGLLGRP